MSTRCKVRIIDTTDKYIEFYHHWDGYPEGVGFELLELLNSFPINKPSNLSPEPNIDIELNTFIRGLMNLEGGKQYEFDFKRHGDIEYLYCVHLKDRSIRCIKGYFEYDEAADGEQTCKFVIEDTPNVKELHENFDGENYS
ncbi:MAG: hypothetical protein R3Y56_10885 [Akkermansia sp.]